MVVVGLEAVVMVAVPGLPVEAVHVPVPVAAMVAVPYWQTLWSGPALGLAVTVTVIVSFPLPVVQTKPYVPATEKPDIIAVGDDEESIVTDTGFVASAVHMPVPKAAIAVDNPEPTWHKL